MKHKKSYNIDEQLLDSIISVAYGDAGFIEKIIVYKWARKNPEIDKLLKEYKATANAVHKLEKEECPDLLLEKVQDITGVKKKSSLGFDLFSIFVSRPMITAGATAVIVLMLMKSIFFPAADYGNYSEAQVMQADKQIKESFALIAKVLNKTKSTIKDDVLTTRVGKPINDGINMVNKLFTEEK